MAVEEARVPMLHDREKYGHSKHNETPPTKPLSVAESHRHLGSPTLVISSLVAGAIAGALAKTTIAPLDRTKINFQISQTPYSWRAAIGFLMHSAKTEGFIALWRGNSATIARIAPYAAIQFTAHEQWKRVLGVDTPHTAQQHRLRHLVAGSLAGVTSQSLTYPLDLARARMAVTHAHQYRTITAVFVKVAGQEGLRTLYRGYPATVMGVVPYAGFSFFTYDSLKHKYLDVTGSLPSGAVNVVFGGAAGALGQTSSYPLDIVRRRMQTAQRRPDGTYPYATIGATLATVYKLEGWRGFFKGLSMNWVKGPVAVGISFATYDAIKMGLRDVASKLNS